MVISPVLIPHPTGSYVILLLKFTSVTVKAQLKPTQIKAKGGVQRLSSVLDFPKLTHNYIIWGAQSLVYRQYCSDKNPPKSKKYEKENRKVKQTNLLAIQRL